MASSFRKHGSTFTSYSFRSSGLVESVEILTSNTLTRFYVIATERTLPMVKVKWIMYILKCIRIRVLQSQGLLICGQEKGKEKKTRRFNSEYILTLNS